MKIYTSEYKSPFGKFYLASSEKGLARLHLTNKNDFLEKLKKTFPDFELVENIEKNETVIHQLNAYFDGKRESFNVPLHIVGTDFHKKVWKELKKITFGKTVSYKQIAERIGNPKSVRAVGQANNRNPIPIIIPCHRIIGANGNLIGYGGGLDMKRKLLIHEGILHL
jgi:methylated-DNA-[protein]-cysteine S-methyltransferase